MLIVLDVREQQLIQECRRYIFLNKELEYIKLEERTLPIGDIIIYDNNNKENIIIERKTVKDLACSIRDNRYSEQSFRLDACSVPNHNIFYLIEGSLLNIGPRFEKKTILSALTSISYHKGFSLYRTSSVCESAEWILRLTDKLKRANKEPYYTSLCEKNSIQDTVDNKDTVVDKKNTEYSDVHKRVKKNNVTIDNIGTILLMQIPGVSAESAKTIMKHFSSFKDLMNKLEDNPKALDGIKQLTKTGKERNLNKTTKANIYNYLVATNSSIINVKT